MFFIPCNSRLAYLNSFLQSRSLQRAAMVLMQVIIVPLKTRAMNWWSDWPQSALSKLHLHIKYSSVLPFTVELTPNHAVNARLRCSQVVEYACPYQIYISDRRYPCDKP